MIEKEKHLSHEEINFGEIYQKTEPNMVEKFTATNAREAQEEFLNDATLRKPNNIYGDITPTSINDLYDNISKSVEYLDNQENLGNIEREMLETSLERKFKSARMIDCANTIKNSQSSEDIRIAKDNFMRDNIELYGAPEKDTFESLVSDELAKIDVDNLNNTSEKIYNDLIGLLGRKYINTEKKERFKPSEETFKKMEEFSRIFYAKQLEYIPKEPINGDKFTPEELCSIFENIVGDFHDSGMEKFDIEWKDSGAISVNSGTKKISIPKNRKSMTRNEVEGLIVHELGTHYMRGQTGNQYKIPTLKNGLDGYLETEEGIARAMEMAVKGEYVEAGIGHYITAGLAFFDSKNFREVFEINWRLKVLSSNKGDLSRGDIENKRKEAYKATQRIFRGTDELPWFKDLSYFNGGQKIWQYIEENIGSEEMFDNFFLGGKNNLLDDSQQRQIYELKVGKR